MYAVIKDIHNIVRWVVLLIGLWAVVRAWWGLRKASLGKVGQAGGCVLQQCAGYAASIGVDPVFSRPS